MTVAEISERAEHEALVYDTAVKIRELLDAARLAYGAADWDANTRQDDVLLLVTEEA